MDNVGIVVADFDVAVAFFTEVVTYADVYRQQHSERQTPIGAKR
jgi:hypothetical protein